MGIDVGEPFCPPGCVYARPQFIKAAVVSPALRAAGIEEILVHTGQHYAWEISATFFEGLRLPEPKYNLQIGAEEVRVRVPLLHPLALTLL